MSIGTELVHIDHAVDHFAHHHDALAQGVANGTQAAVNGMQNFGNSLSQGQGTIAPIVGASMLAHPVGWTIGLSVVGIAVVGAAGYFAWKKFS